MIPGLTHYVAAASSPWAPARRVIPFRSSPKSEGPASLSTMISPSTMALFNPRLFAACTRSRYFAIQSRPLRGVDTCPVLVDDQLRAVVVELHFVYPDVAFGRLLDKGRFMGATNFKGIYGC